jgi:hypothetical protein
MFPEKDTNRLTLLQSDYLNSLAETFLLDRRTQGLSWKTIQFYRDKLKQFSAYCESQALSQVGD